MEVAGRLNGMNRLAALLQTIYVILRRARITGRCDVLLLDDRSVEEELVARRGAWFATLMIVCNGGCTTFAAVRSAEVVPGYSHDMGITLVSAPGDEAAWFWSLECEVNCDHAILSFGMSSSYGIVSDEGHAYELGWGLAGT